jgi:hypothetical protein
MSIVLGYIKSLGTVDKSFALHVGAEEITFKVADDNHKISVLCESCIFTFLHKCLKYLKFSHGSNQTNN